jgi:predicted DNA-binding protein (UPF0251 family)
MDRLETNSLTLDGLEALRLADLEGLYQEEAAERMGVSRATFARTLTAARKAMADALVNGKALEIGGGTVVRRATRSWPCPIHGRRRRRGRACRCPGRRGDANRRAPVETQDTQE